MTQDLAAALERLLPAPNYAGSLTSNTRQAYDLLIWYDPRPKPTYEQLLQVDLSRMPSPELKAHLARTRYWRSVGGFIHDGHTFASDERSQAALALASVSRIGTVLWKTVDGQFVKVNARALAAACVDFISGLFETEAQLCRAIDASLVTTKQEIEAAIGADHGTARKDNAQDRDNSYAADGGFPD